LLEHICFMTRNFGRWSELNRVTRHNPEGHIVALISLGR
jgi:hypothetical protein